MSISASSSVCGYIWIHRTSELQGPREVVQSSLPLTETSVHETTNFSVKLHHPVPSQLLHVSNIPVTCCALSELGKALFFGPGTLNLYLINSYYNPVMNAHLPSFYSCENWGLEMLSNLSKVTQLVNGIQPNSVWIWSPCSFLHDFTTFKKSVYFLQVLSPFCHGLNDAIPRCVCWSFNLPYDSIWGWTFRRYLGLVEVMRVGPSQ